ncbi:MAG: endonuclease [Bacteroidales bacterium]|nr:endonuclease [Bacteroidales bacterium]
MRRILAFIVLISTGVLVLAQRDSCSLLISFYNVENLYDPDNDSLFRDDDFTPEGLYHWTYGKYVKKVNNIAKVLIAMGEGEPPDIAAMAEVENDRVFQRFCYRSPLQKFNYGYVHFDSPYSRGVETGLLYRKDRLQIVHKEAIAVVFPFEPATKNREILYVMAKTHCGDSLHLFVNHWTSRYGGYGATVPKRNYYAQVLRQRVDSLLLLNPATKIIIMGDFNDYPTDESVSRSLGASDRARTDTASLYNLMYRFLKMNNIGTHKHEDFWGCLDQIIVSPSLVDSSFSGIHIVGGEAHIFKEDFMVVPDEKYGGYKVFRTFLGPRYIGGYGDHLPVFVKLKVEN